MAIIPRAILIGLFEKENPTIIGMNILTKMSHSQAPLKNCKKDQRKINNKNGNK